MTPPVNIDRRSAVSLRAVGGGKGSPAAAAAAAMTQASTRLATALTAELDLAEIDPHARYSGGTASDAYGVEDLAAELVQAMGGGAKERGEVARALHGFVSEGAALFAARPESGSVERLSAAIAGAQSDRAAGSDLDRVIGTIDDAVRRLQATAR